MRNVIGFCGFAAALLVFGTAVPAQAALTISNGATSNVNCSGGVCAATGRYAVLNATALASMLGSGDVTVKSGSVADHIFVAAPFSWVSTNRLTLDSRTSISVNRQVVVAGPGGLTIVTNDGGRGGALSFVGKGSVAFWDLSSSLVIDGTSYTLVGNIDDLASSIASNSAGSFALAANYHSNTSYTSSPISTTFTGKFEGLGNLVFYLAINDSSGGYDGLFARIGAGGSVRDIGLIKANVNGGNRTGTLAGENDGVIANSYSTGRVTHQTNGGYLGGLVGWNSGSIAGSYSEASVSGSFGSSAGGLVGSNVTTGPTSTITNSHATGAVRAGKAAYVGGLVGSNYGAVSGSYASGTASGGYDADVAGLAGQSWGSITASFATGNVSITNFGNAGGLVGAMASNGTVQSQVIDSYATGSVTGLTSNLGSLLGECCFNADTLIERAYGIGATSGAPKAAIGGVVGEDVGQHGNSFSTDYWDTDTTGIANSAQGASNVANDPGLTGLSDAQLKSGVPGGFSPTVWGQSAGINSGYPYLLANPPS